MGARVLERHKHPQYGRLYIELRHDSLYSVEQPADQGVRIQIGIGLGPDFAALAAKQQQQPTIELTELPAIEASAITALPPVTTESTFATTETT